MISSSRQVVAVNKTALITAIKHFAVHDGDGIRTTVFFKGCGLKCVWCHNPEGISFHEQLAYMIEKCVNCGQCCECEANRIEEGKHIFDRQRCRVCGRCLSRCPNGAFRLYGREMTVDEVLAEVLEDKAFYANSGGGVTLSGGEALYHTDFCVDLLKKLKEQGIHTAVDTSGFVPDGAIEKVMPYTDIFLFDLKAADPQVHKRCTGHTNERILQNLQWIDSHEKDVEIRIPFVPDFNDGEIPAIADIIGSLHRVKRVRVLPYHSYARSRYAALGMTDTLPETIPNEERISAARLLLQQRLPFIDIN